LLWPGFNYSRDNVSDINNRETKLSNGFGHLRGVRGAVYRLGLWRQRSAFALRGLSSYASLRMDRRVSFPQIAAVMVGRNDDYMSDFAERLFATIDWNNRYLISEVLFVEWNPPRDRSLLGPQLTQRFPNVRVYVVPPEIHSRICENSNINLLEYHAKNVGIRRARSPWIMATNADAALGLDAINKIIKTELDPQVAWTAERVDIHWREDAQRKLALVDSLRYRRMIPYHQLGTGEFILASRKLWQRTGGYDERMVRHRIGCDVRGTAQMLALGASIQKVGSVLHLAHPTSCTEQIQPHHGEMAPLEGLPYENGPNWGLGQCVEVSLGERIWQLELD
jgi:hypothetical protein